MIEVATMVCIVRISRACLAANSELLDQTQRLVMNEPADRCFVPGNAL